MWRSLENVLLQTSRELLAKFTRVFNIYLFSKWTFYYLAELHSRHCDGSVPPDWRNFQDLPRNGPVGRVAILGTPVFCFLSSVEFRLLEQPFWLANWTSMNWVASLMATWRQNRSTGIVSFWPDRSSFPGRTVHLIQCDPRTLPPELQQSRYKLYWLNACRISSVRSTDE